MVRTHLLEAAVVVPLLADEDRVHCRLHVVVDAPPAYPAEEAEGPLVRLELDPSRKSGGALHRLHCFCLEFDGACEVPRRVPTDWIIEPVDVSGYGSFSLAS